MACTLCDDSFTPVVVNRKAIYLRDLSDQPFRRCARFTPTELLSRVEWLRMKAATAVHCLHLHFSMACSRAGGLHVNRMVNAGVMGACEEDSALATVVCGVDSENSAACARNPLHENAPSLQLQSIQQPTEVERTHDCPPQRLDRAPYGRLTEIRGENS